MDQRLVNIVETFRPENFRIFLIKVQVDWHILTPLS